MFNNLTTPEEVETYTMMFAYTYSAYKYIQIYTKTYDYIQIHTNTYKYIYMIKVQKA